MGLGSNRMDFRIVLISFIGILFFVGISSIIMSILYESNNIISPAQLKLKPEPVDQKDLEEVFGNDFEFDIDEDLLD